MRETLLMILAFVLLVVVHELGHMTAAKRMKVKVTEFGIGIPPKICRIYQDKHGTNYTLNLIPLGGFVRLHGDNPHDTKNYTRHGSYHAASTIRKITILIAGVLFNIITAWLIFVGVLISGTKPLAILPDETMIDSHLMPSQSTAIASGILTIHEDYPARIIDTKENSRAHQHLLERDTIITHINDKNVYAHNLNETLQTLCREYACDITRQPPTKTTPQTSSYQCTDQCLLGVVVDTSDMITIHPIQLTIGQAFKVASEEIIKQTKFTFSSLYKLGQTLLSGNATERQSTASALSGPVGIVGIGGSIIKNQQRSQWWILIGMISLALGLFNLLPIPALDGGRIVSVLIHKFSRIPPHKYYPKEAIINTIVMVALMIGGIIIMAKDASQIYCWENPISETIFGESAQCIQTSTQK